jgi:hypothetical protein
MTAGLTWIARYLSGLIIGVSLMTSTIAEAADLNHIKIHKTVRRIISNDVPSAADLVCRGGWLQTLDWGRVRPRYTVWCWAVNRNS